MLAREMRRRREWGSSSKIPHSSLLLSHSPLLPLGRRAVTPARRSAAAVPPIAALLPGARAPAAAARFVRVGDVRESADFARSRVRMSTAVNASSFRRHSNMRPHRLHEHTDHIVTLLYEQMGRDAGIDSATHRQHNSRHNASLGLPITSGKTRGRRNRTRHV